MKTCLLLCALLAGVLAAPRQEPSPRQEPRQEPYGKKTPPAGKKPLPEGKKPSPESKKPAPGDKQDTGVPSPRTANVLGCGSHVIAEGSSYVIKSPNHPNNYPNNVDCSYTLTTSSGKDIKLTCAAFNLESHSRCSYDWLKINGVKYCGSTAPSPVAAPQMNIEFHSDYSVIRTGYQCSVTLSGPVTPSAGSTLACGSSRLGRGQYTITDGAGDYSNYVDCYYQLATIEDGDQISVTCSSFDVERHSSCAYDWLEVAGTKFCGTTGPDGAAAQTQMNIHWHTDYSVVRPGFVCNVDVAVPPPPPTLACGSSRLERGQYTITDGAGEYSNYVDCYYQLETIEDGDQISVTCSSFDVERHSSCAYDWLEVAGTKFCGTTGPDGAAAQTQMNIHWHTDYSVVRPGFVCNVDVAVPPPPPSPQPPQDCSCGNVNRATRIVGGTETDVNEYPWQAGIVSTGGTRTWCGGSIINSLYVMTAAHCTVSASPSSIQVLLREHAIGTADGEIRVNVQQIKNHPNYNSGTMSNDFSLLKLATAVTFPADNKMAPVCLPSAGNNFVGADAVVTGWGTTSSGGSQATSLREVTVPIIANTACQGAYTRNTIDGTMICAGLLGTGGKDSCQGDSGGPLVSLEGGKYSLAGVVSWGIGCADSSYPGVYARVTAVLPWIQSNTIEGEYCSN